MLRGRGIWVRAASLPNIKVWWPELFWFCRDRTIPASRIPLLASVGGSMVTRTASRIAFGQKGRSVVTQDMLPVLGEAFTEIFGDHKSAGKL